MSRLGRALIVLLLVLLGACADPHASGSGGVAVMGGAGEPPKLTFKAPITIDAALSQEVWPGVGPALTAGGPVLLHMYGEDGRDHSPLVNTYATGPRMFTLDEKSLGAGMAKALQGCHVGARILFEQVDGGVPVVLVLDVLPTQAYGEKVQPADGLPTVAADSTGSPTITIPPEAAPPTDLVVQPLIRGSGAQIEPGHTLTVRYTEVLWSTGAVYDTNWADPHAAPLTATAGVGTLMEGWEQGLLEQSVGSRVLLIVPPDLAYGGSDLPVAEDTFVIVVDILDSHPVATTSTEGP